MRPRGELEPNDLRAALAVAERTVETLRARVAAVESFAAAAAHEINNPLTATIVHLARAARECRARGHEPLAEDLEIARYAAERVEEIVRQLAAFARLDAEPLQAVDVGRVMRQTLRMARTRIDPHTRVVEQYGDDLYVHANESRLGQVFLNLLVNAAQAIPAGPAESNEIRVTTTTGISGDVIVAVTDTGRGIPSEILEQIFTPFFTTKPPEHGTGLGLTICEQLVTRFGGRITVESAVGAGSVFRVHLPAAPRGPREP